MTQSPDAKPKVSQIPKRFLRLKGEAYVGFCTAIGIDDQFFVVAADTDALKRVLAEEFPNLEYTESGFVKVAIFSTK